MMNEATLAVLRALEERDAEERREGVDRSERLRQVTPEVGRFLHLLVLAARPRRILEIGASGGYSTTWLAAAAQTYGGALTTLENDPKKVALVRRNLAVAGLDAVASVVEGDAFDYLRRRDEPFDFCFLDAEKEDYEAYLGLIVPLLSEGGLLVADNLLSHAAELDSFREAALADQRLSAVVVPIGRGELVAVRLTP